MQYPSNRVNLGLAPSLVGEGGHVAPAARRLRGADQKNEAGEPPALRRVAVGLADDLIVGATRHTSQPSIHATVPSAFGLQVASPLPQPTSSNRERHQSAFHLRLRRPRHRYLHRPTASRGRPVGGGCAGTAPVAEERFYTAPTWPVPRIAWARQRCNISALEQLSLTCRCGWWLRRVQHADDQPLVREAVDRPHQEQHLLRLNSCRNFWRNSNVGWATAASLPNIQLARWRTKCIATSCIVGQQKDVARPT
jgi:hypothetical protein